MKNIIKKLFLYLLLVSSLTANAGPGDPCALATLVSNLSTSGTEFKTGVLENAQHHLFKLFLKITEVY